MPGISFDRISFWLGFVAATLFWWIFSRLKHSIPSILSSIREIKNTIKRNRLVDVYQNIMKTTLEVAQNAHIANKLFSLDEVLIQPKILIQPFPPDYAEQLGERLIQTLLPNTSESPEITSIFPFPATSLLEALNASKRIALIAPIGYGKTITLAHLSSQLARGETSRGGITGLIPGYIHISDINLDPDNDSVKAIVQAISPRISLLLQSRLSDAITQAIQNEKFILILDGLDELHPQQFDESANYLDRLLGSYPTIYCVIAITPDNCKNISRLGFSLVGIKGWSPTERDQFVNKWQKAWNSKILPDVKNSKFEPIDNRLIRNWLIRPGYHYSPFAWTLITWASFSGDMKSPSIEHAFQSFISRTLSEPSQQALKSTAQQLFKNRISFTMNLFPKSKQKERDNQDIGEKTRDDNVSNTDLDEAIKAGILVQNPNGRIRFCHPLIFGYFLSQASEDTFRLYDSNLIKWSVFLAGLQQISSRGIIPEWIQSYISTDTPPGYAHTITLSKWLIDLPASHPFRSSLLKRIVSLITNDQVQFSVRMKLISSILFANEPSSYRLVKQLSSFPNPTLKKIACLGFAYLPDEQAIEDLWALLSDPDPEVQKFACLAAVSFPGDKGLKMCLDIITKKDEYLRRIVAESLSEGDDDRHELLKELSDVDDLLVRRAVVYGLMHIREAWSKSILEKLALQDSQWVVRNAAAGVLEFWEKSSPFILRSKPNPDQAGWLIQFAGKHGEVLPKNQFPLHILQKALEEGSSSEKILAMEYLQDYPSEDVIQSIEKCLQDPDKKVQESAITALWIATQNESSPN